VTVFDQITGSPQAVRELIQRLSRLREADDRMKGKAAKLMGSARPPTAKPL